MLWFLIIEVYLIVLFKSRERMIQTQNDFEEESRAREKLIELYKVKFIKGN